MVTVYVSVVRTVLEYACPVWHTILPKYLSDKIEIIQKGHHIFFSWIRLRLCQKYFDKIKVATHRLNHMLPEKGIPNMILEKEMCTR